MLELTNELDWAANSQIVLSLMSVYPKAYFNIRGFMKKELDVGMKKGDLEVLLEKGVNEKIIGDQLLVANRANSLLSGIWSWIEDKYFSLGNGMSGNSRHSLVLMCSYGDGSPLKELRLGRYEGNDFLKGSPVDLMGDNSEARKTLREIRNREGIGSLVINGAYSFYHSVVTYRFYHSGVQLPGVSLENNNYDDKVERGSKTGAMIEFSRRHPTHSNNPVWFYRLNGDKSIIQNGAEYKLCADN